MTSELEHKIGKTNEDWRTFLHTSIQLLTMIFFTSCSFDSFAMVMPIGSTTELETILCGPNQSFICSQFQALAAASPPAPRRLRRTKRVRTSSSSLGRFTPPWPPPVNHSFSSIRRERQLAPPRQLRREEYLDWRYI
jgi:hypothetical protein